MTAIMTLVAKLNALRKVFKLISSSSFDWLKINSSNSKCDKWTVHVKTIVPLGVHVMHLIVILAIYRDLNREMIKWFWLWVLIHQTNQCLKLILMVNIAGVVRVRGLYNLYFISLCLRKRWLRRWNNIWWRRSSLLFLFCHIEWWILGTRWGTWQIHSAGNRRAVISYKRQVILRWAK